MNLRYNGDKHQSTNIEKIDSCENTKQRFRNIIHRSSLRATIIVHMKLRYNEVKHQSTNIKSSFMGNTNTNPLCVSK